MSSAFTNRSITSKNNSGTFSKSGQQRSIIAILSRMFNTLYRVGLTVFKSFRSFLWIGSTALIFMLIPIGFSMLSETELEYQKLERASQMAAGGAGGAAFRSM